MKRSVNVEVFQNVKNIDNWYFPCNVFQIEIIERDEKDEELSKELNDVIKNFLIDKNIDKSTFKYSYS